VQFAKDGFVFGKCFNRMIAAKFAIIHHFKPDRRQNSSLFPCNIFIKFFDKLESASVNPFEIANEGEENHAEASVCNINHHAGGDRECSVFRLHDGSVAPAKSTY